MADDYTVLCPGSGGDNVDVESVTYGVAPTTRKRSRIEVCGAAQTEVARVQNTATTGTEYGLVTRPIQNLGTFSNKGASVGTSAAQINSGSVATNLGVQVKASNANTGTVYLGSSSSVTAGTSAATDGYELGAGESVFLPVNNANLIWAIASASSQKVYFLVF